MTLTLLQLAPGAGGLLLLGYLGGRRSYRRQIQTTEGRQRAGIRRQLRDVSLDDLAGALDEPATTRLDRVIPETQPQPTVVIPAQR